MNRSTISIILFRFFTLLFLLINFFIWFSMLIREKIYYHLPVQQSNLLIIILHLYFIVLPIALSIITIILFERKFKPNKKNKLTFVFILFFITLLTFSYKIANHDSLIANLPYLSYNFQKEWFYNKSSLFSNCFDYNYAKQNVVIDNYNTKWPLEKTKCVTGIVQQITKTQNCDILNFCNSSECAFDVLICNKEKFKNIDINKYKGKNVKVIGFLNHTKIHTANMYIYDPNKIKIK